MPNPWSQWCIMLITQAETSSKLSQRNCQQLQREPRSSVCGQVQSTSHFQAAWKKVYNNYINKEGKDMPVAKQEQNNKNLFSAMVPERASPLQYKLSVQKWPIKQCLHFPRKLIMLFMAQVYHPQLCNCIMDQVYSQCQLVFDFSQF